MLKGKRVVLVLAGGNIDSSALGRIIDVGLVADGRLCRFTVTISDRPGGLARLAEIIAAAGASIKEIVHDRAFAGPDLSAVRVVCVAETTGTTTCSGCTRRCRPPACRSIRDRVTA
jgi:threonine dehydratase